jgi:hypothetical protein
MVPSHRSTEEACGRPQTYGTSLWQAADQQKKLVYMFLPASSVEEQTVGENWRACCPRGRRIFLNIVAAHSEGLRHPPYVHLIHFSRVNVPLRQLGDTRQRTQLFRVQIRPPHSLLNGVRK